MRVGRAQLELSAVFAGGPGSRVTNHPGVAGTFPDEALKVPHPGKPSPSRHTRMVGHPIWIYFLFYKFSSALGPCPLNVAKVGSAWPSSAQYPVMWPSRAPGEVQILVSRIFFPFRTSNSNLASLQMRAFKWECSGFSELIPFPHYFFLSRFTLAGPRAVVASCSIPSAATFQEMAHSFLSLFSHFEKMLTFSH